MKMYLLTENINEHMVKWQLVRRIAGEMVVVIILGDSHARGMTKELQHRLGKSFEVEGIVKPGGNIKEITNMFNSTVSSRTKNVCVVWEGT
jgi:hypothetical protein